MRFINCKSLSLQKIIFHKPNPSSIINYDDSVFGGCPSNCIAVVPRGTLKDYENIFDCLYGRFVEEVYSDIVDDLSGNYMPYWDGEKFKDSKLLRDKIPQYQDNGCLSVAYPVANSDAATKAFVLDNAVDFHSDSYSANHPVELYADSIYTISCSASDLMLYYGDNGQIITNSRYIWLVTAIDGNNKMVVNGFYGNGNPISGIKVDPDERDSRLYSCYVQSKNGTIDVLRQTKWVSDSEYDMSLTDIRSWIDMHKDEFAELRNQKADKGESGTITIKSTDWSGYTFTTTILDLGENDAIFFTPLTKDDKNNIEDVDIFISSEGNQVTFICEYPPRDSIDIKFKYFIVRGQA